MSDRLPDYEEVVSSLPLEMCTVAKNSMFASYEADCETEYIAPHGYTFQMLGKFSVWLEASDFDRSYEPPVQSRQSFIDEDGHREKIEQLKAHGMSTSQAFEIFATEYFDERSWQYDPYTPPEAFAGRTLAIRSEDHASSWELAIKGPVDAGTEPAVKKIKLPTGNGNERTTGMSLPDVHIWWSREVAIGVFNECRVELVAHEEPDAKLWLPKVREKSLWKTGDNAYPDLVDEYGAFAGLFIATRTEIDIRETELRPEKAEQESPF